MEKHVTISPGAGVGVLVLSGSSGRVEEQRCDLLAEHGVTAMSIRWWGGAGQPPGICEVPLETFVAALDLLVETGVSRLAVLGGSKGAEAALMLACLEPRVNVVIAVSPSSVVWANIGPGLDGASTPYRSSWTWHGKPLPFTPYPAEWPDHGPPMSFRAFYERGLAAAPPESAIPLERTRADVLLVAGADDQLWPSLTFAEALAERREVRIVSHPSAGHRPRFPGESPAQPSPSFLYGGSADADAALGAAAWPHVLAMLGS
ncbi:acyl-CoA thioester hydrolase/BAAT C-terminal domain-containing protein [Nonomuraea sp. NPDC050691]|uniref:acyl-CoA thioester hydrolase/BAAT C-terminal domain-containing protein n=1 Tax=Nonomuraea sp. NPDC050691 TaxID=3155661 RepID=UPI0033DDC75B